MPGTPGGAENADYRLGQLHHMGHLTLSTVTLPTSCRAHQHQTLACLFWVCAIGFICAADFLLKMALSLGGIVGIAKALVDQVRMCM